MPASHPHPPRRHRSLATLVALSWLALVSMVSADERQSTATQDVRNFLCTSESFAHVVDHYRSFGYVIERREQTDQSRMAYLVSENELERVSLEERQCPLGRSGAESGEFVLVLSARYSVSGGSVDEAKQLIAELTEATPVFHAPTVSMAAGYDASWTIHPICGVKGLRAGFDAVTEQTYVQWTKTVLP